MRIVSLNTYFGFCFEELMEFVKREASATDVFCFQEVTSAINVKNPTTTRGRRIDLLGDLRRHLPEFDDVFEVMADDLETDISIDGHSQVGVATFVRKNFSILRTESVFIANARESFDGKDVATLGHVALRTDLNIRGLVVVIVNIHGISEPADKRDCAVRVRQSERVLALAEHGSSPCIILGDFNLFPDTESIRMIEESGYRNLVNEFGITTTRGSNMHKLFPQYEHGKYGFQEFADYAFASPEVRVLDFVVPDVAVSDHLPLILEIDG